MPRQPSVSVQNNFVNGLVTEATGLNFPENAATETYDCVFNRIGNVERRKGFNFETDYTTQDVDKTNAVFTNYVWKNVSGNGDKVLIVVQVGSTLYFYEATSTVDPISTGYVDSLDISTYEIGTLYSKLYDCQYSDGNGLLFVTNPVCKPFYVSYDILTQTVTGTGIDIMIRDFEGDQADPYDVDEQPTTTYGSMNVHHTYNLLNQGWTDTNLTDWDTAQTTMPSNADINYLYKNSSNVFDFTSTTADNVVIGNTAAPKGHYIVDPFSIDRDTVAGLSGTTATSLSEQRFSTSAFFAGRVFYSGINARGYTSKIYFTQIIERDEQYGFCYQANDPTSEDFFDLLSSDGGVINIIEGGVIIKLFSTPQGLLVFATNGIWVITGSQGIGFTANDYTVLKVSSVKAIGADSFVDFNGFPVWWDESGIFTVEYGQNGIQVKSLSFTKIKDFFELIPSTSKRHAKGAFDPYTGIIQWVYKTESTSEATAKHEYDRVLNYNTITGAFYPWTLPLSPVTINGMLILTPIENFSDLTAVVDSSGNFVVDGSSNQVESYVSLVQAPFTIDESQLPKFKYICTYNTAGQDKLTFAEATDTSYTDWYNFPSGSIDFSSYFTIGYNIKGEGLRKFQANWLNVFNNTDEDIEYTVQSIWDYGRASSTIQTLSIPAGNTVTKRRLKIRGNGIVLQFKFASVSGEPFDIIGWSAFDTTNQLP